MRRGRSSIAIHRRVKRGSRTISITVEEGRVPQISTDGDISWTDVLEAKSAFSNLYPSFLNEDLSLQELIDKTWERISENEAFETSQSQTYLSAHPWVCEWCNSRRFKTKRGCAQHEALCRKRYCPECRAGYASYSFVDASGNFSERADTHLYKCSAGHSWSFPERA